MSGWVAPATRTTWTKPSVPSSSLAGGQSASRQTSHKPKAAKNSWVRRSRRSATGHRCRERLYCQACPPSSNSRRSDGAKFSRLNLGGTYRCFPRRSAHDGRGRLGTATGHKLNDRSSAGLANHVHYAVSKAGIVGLVRALAVEVGMSGITVNAVAPGVIETHQSADPINSLGPDRTRRQPSPRTSRPKRHRR